jgi:NAD(P)-dependent dehydrogenase (short-subunit alcohol dehydrogenase family)
MDGYPTGSIQNLPDELWSDALSTHVLSSLTLTRSFIPLSIDQNARILVLTPNLVAPLRPALNGTESIVVGALEGFVGTLRRELGAFGVKVVHMKLGDIDFGRVSGIQSSSSSPSRSTSEGGWSRSLYGSPATRATGRTNSGSKGTLAKELHHAVFDALTMKSPWRTTRIGRGSLVYEMIGKWVPDALTQRMLRTDVAMANELLTSQGWEKMGDSALTE